MCHCGINDGATENVMPIQRPDATEVSTEIAAPVVQCNTDVSLAAVATAPPEDHMPVHIAVELAPGKPTERMIN